MTRTETVRTVCLLATVALLAALAASPRDSRAQTNAPPADKPAAAPQPAPPAVVPAPQSPAAAPQPAPPAVAPASAPQPPAAAAPQPPAAAAPQQPAARGLFPPQPEAPGDKSGFLRQFGKWWDDSVADFNAKMKDAKDKFDDLNKKQSEAAKEAAAKTQEAMKNAAQATKDAADAMVRMSTAKMIEVHDRCPVAANGAPDCQITATNACHAKGYATGKPADVQTSQQCPAAVLLSGRTPAPGECPVENVLMRAVCQ